MVAIRGGVEAFLARDVDGGTIEPYTEIVRAASESFKHVDDLTVLNGAQGVSEIIARVIGQAGPALEMAQAALARNRDGDGPQT